MGSSNADILARLTLNGSQFSSENARLFAEMEARSRDAAGRTKAAFESSFNEIQQIAQRALSLPRNAGGSINLDVAGARQAAAAAEAEAIALREIATAAEVVAVTNRDLTESTRVYIQAARAAALEAENNARALLQQANALDMIQVELNQTASATDMVVLKNRQLNASMGGSGMVAVQASQQFQDFFIQVGGGANVISAFAMQTSQLAYIMTAAGGSSSKFASILAGPWGTAVLAGLTLVGLFGDKLFTTNNELEKAIRNLREQARSTDVAADAQRAFEQSSEGVISAIRKQNEELDKYNQTLRDTINLEIDAAKRHLETSKNNRDVLSLQALQTRQRIDDLKAAGAANTDPNAAGAESVEILRLERKLAELTAEIGRLNANIPGAERAVRGSERKLTDLELQRQRDPSKKAAADLEEEMKRLAKAFDDNKLSAEAYRREQIKALDKYDADMKRLRDAEAAARRDTREAERSIRLAAPVDGSITSGYGTRAAPATRGGGRGSTYHPAIDYGVGVGTPVRAGADGVVVYTGTLGGFGKVVIVDYGKGTMAQFAHLSQTLANTGDRVAAGQVIARTGDTGNVSGPHLDYRVKTGVTGVENGRMIGGSYVDPTKTRVKIGTAGDAVADFENRMAEADEKHAEALANMQKASQNQLSVEADSLRLLGLKVRGLDEQAAVEGEIAEKRRRYEEDMSALSAADRASQEKRTEGLSTEINLLIAQGDAYAKLLVAAGDQTALTDEQRKALDDANGAMLAQLTAARALAKTAADRLALEEAISRVQGRLSAASDEGADRARKEKRAQEEIEREQKKMLEERRRDEEDSIRGLADFYRNAFRSGGKSIVQDFKDEMLDMIALVAARWTFAMLSGQKTSLGSIFQQMGAQSGAGSQFPLLNMLGMFGGGGGGASAGSSMTGQIGNWLGMGGSAAGGAAGGIGGLFGGGGAAAGGMMASIGAAVPQMAAAMAITSVVSDVLGIKNEAGGMFGILGNIVIGWAKSTKRGSATLGFNEYGELGVGSSRGNSSKRIEASTGAIGSISDALKRIADGLGGSLTGSPSVSIGMREGNWRVDPTGQGITKTKNGAIDFGKDQEAAIRYAIGEALRDGVIAGISAASKKILASGQELERAIEKAVRIEEIPKRLAALLDPVGFAIDEFNKDWQKTIDALKEGGASAEQMAEAQKLYRLELEQVKATAKEASSGLKDFLADLNFGSASPYSLRDQEAMARASLQPFLDKINAGERIDQGKYTEAAQKYLEIERQLYGSGGSFFAAMDLVQAATNKAINTIDNAKPIRTEADPWLQATATNTGTANDLLEQVSNQLANLPQSLAEAIMGYRTTGDRSFFENPRGLLRDIAAQG